MKFVFDEFPGFMFGGSLWSSMLIDLGCHWHVPLLCDHGIGGLEQGGRCQKFGGWRWKTLDGRMEIGKKGAMLNAKLTETPMPHLQKIRSYTTRKELST